MSSVSRSARPGTSHVGSRRETWHPQMESRGIVQRINHIATFIFSLHLVELLHRPLKTTVDKRIAPTASVDDRIVDVNHQRSSGLTEKITFEHNKKSQSQQLTLRAPGIATRVDELDTPTQRTYQTGKTLPGAAWD